MIAEKLRMIKSKSTEPSPILTANNQSNFGNQVLNLTSQEITQISTRLHQIRPQIPQIDKLLLLHAKLVNPPLNTLEMIKKLTDCRNILVNQIEISVGGGRKNFAMNFSQLNLLIEQVQRLFNSLVSKMKESAGVSPALTTTTAASTTTSSSASKSANTTFSANITNTSGNPAATSSSALSTTSSLHNSSISSILSSSKQKPNLKSSSNTSNSGTTLLLQRLSMPPDLSIDFDDWLKRFIVFNSSRNPGVRTTNQRHLKLRNRLLNHELKSLKQSYHIQDCGLGNLNVLISTETHRFIFQVSQKYPYEQLIYRIEAKTKTNNKGNVRLLPKNREPKTFPLTISSILRNFKE